MSLMPLYTNKIDVVTIEAQPSYVLKLLIL